MRERSLGEWVVLALVAERTTHGFDVARTLAPTGSLGRIWTVPRPLVYRAVDALLDDGALEEAGTMEGRGPRRRLLRATPAGRRQVRGWMREPVVHVRDVRSELLVKLALHDRTGADPTALVARQRARIADIADRLSDEPTATDGFDAVLARWRLESAAAVLRFLDGF